MVDLKRFRSVNKITQIELADYFGVGQPFISQMEKGDRPIPDEYISKLLANENWDTSMLACKTIESESQQTTIDRLLLIIESQQRTIENLSETIKNLTSRVE